MSEPSFEPAVLALLQEIAKDPEASLLRIPKERLLRYVGRPEETISPHGSYLTKAEKHLVTAYREQAARVLVEACILRLKEDPLVYSRLNSDEVSLRTSAQVLLPRLPPEELPVQALHALAHGMETSKANLAASSLRLAPSELALNALAVAHQQEGHDRASMRVLRRVFDGASSLQYKAEALAIMARACVARQDFEKAFELGYQASLAAPRRVMYVAWCMTDALQAGNDSRTLEMARRVDESPGEAELAQILQGMRSGRSRCLWAPTHASLQLIPRIRYRLSDRSRAICETFV